MFGIMVDLFNVSLLSIDGYASLVGFLLSNYFRGKALFISPVLNI